MQPQPAALLGALALPFVGAALAPAVYRVLGERTAYYAAAIAAASLGLLVSQYGTQGAVVLDWIPSLGVSFVLYFDGLAFLIGLLASGVGVLVFVYSKGYMHHEPGRMKYYTTMLVFMGAMMGVALAADLVTLFLFWELTSVASFLLIGHYREAEASLYGARKSMLVTVAGGLFMLVGFLLLRSVSGDALGEPTFALVGTAGSMIGQPVAGEPLANAAAMREALSASGLSVPVLILVGLGAATKSAQVPFHIWLPNAMEAPTPVSAFLHSATMVKAGVYLVGRFRPLLLGPEAGLAGDWTLAFAVLGLLTMTVAAVLAVGATDIKELLAYSTASHLGLIVAGFGFADALGAETGAFHILNHASFKAALFLVAGIVAHEAGTRDIRQLGGLWRDLPVTAAVTVFAALSMAGLPPLNGFYSKELLFEAAWETGHTLGGAYLLFPAIAVFGSVFTFLYSVRFLMLFFGNRPDALGEVPRPPVAMVAPAVVLGLAVAAISAAPNAAIDLVVGSVFESTLPAPTGKGFSVAFPTKLKPAVVMSIVTIAVGAVALPFYGRIHRTVRRLREVRPLRPNTYYDGFLAAGERLGRGVPVYVQTRRLYQYAAAVLLATVALTLGGYVAGAAALPGFDGVALGAPLIIVLAVAVIGAVAVDAAPSHVAGVLTLSILGFMVAIFYVLASAPDLALTQLVVETLVLVLFLLVLDRLPAWYGEIKRARLVTDSLISAAVGLTVTVTVLLTTSAEPEDGIATFFLERAPVPEEHGPILTDVGGGSNVVNVILVDFRALDTMGEIAVVAIAALAVLTLVGMRERGETP